MSLPLQTDSLESVPVEVHGMYEQQDDGKFRLRVDGLEEERKSYKQKVDEFRENNIKLRKQQEELEAKLNEMSSKFDGVDPEEYKKIKEQTKAAKDKELIDKGKTDELIAEHTKLMKADYDNKVTALQKKIEERETKLQGLIEELKREKIDNQVQLYVNKIGVPIAPGAINDIINRARSVFSMDDDFNAVALDVNGGKIPGKNGITPLSIEEWTQNLPVELPYFFQTSEGMGSRGSRKGASADIKNIKDPLQRVSAFRRGERAAS